jgi:hypothetical protein
VRATSWILSIVFLLATGCGRIHYLRPEKSFTENDSDAIVVLRVVPNAFIEIQHGYVNGDGWFTYGTMEPPQFWTEGGFLVAKLRPTEPGEAYALIKIRPDGTWPGYFAEEDSRIPVFSAVAGLINYAGAITLRWGKSDDQPDTDGPDDAEDADDTNDAHSGKDGLALSACSCESDEPTVARFMAKHYPRVRAKVIANPLHMERTLGKVHPWTPIILPIYPIR